MKNMYFATTLALLILAGCNNDRYDGPDVAGTKATIWANISGVQTRASDTEWTINDQIGITVGDGSDPRATNIPFMYSGTPGQPFNLVGENELYVKSQIEVPVTAYYPYTGTEGVASEGIEINTEDQTAGTQPKIDFLFAQTTTSRTTPNINLLFFHKMSKLIFKFESEDPEASIGNLSYTLNGITAEGTFIPSTGEILPAETTGKVSTPETLNTTSSLILIPQTGTNVELEVLVGNKYYVATIENLKLNSGYAHTYTVTIKNLDEAPHISVSEGAISPWIPGEGGEIEAPEHKPNNEPSVEVPAWGSEAGGEIESQPKTDKQ